MERDEEIETGRVKIENEEMQGPRLHIPFLSEPVETLDSDLGPRSWVDNCRSIECHFPNGYDSVRQDRLHNLWNLTLELSSPSPLDGAIVSNIKKQRQFAHLQRAVQV